MPHILPIPSARELTTNPAKLPERIDLQGWNSDHPVFEQLIREVEPHLIIEVGSWKGCSAIHMAELTATPREKTSADVPNDTLTPAIICVDTWLGGIDHMLSTKPQDNLFRDELGNPKLYEQFLRNALESGFAERIFPLRQTSANAARFLKRSRVFAELIYIDGSHEYEDVYADLVAYSELLRGSGLIFGDDFRNFPGVFAAVVRYAHETGKTLRIEADNFWIIK